MQTCALLMHKENSLHFLYGEMSSQETSSTRGRKPKADRFISWFVFHFRRDQKARDWLHIRGRRGVLENLSVHCASANGWVETAGPTQGNSALSVTSTCTHTNRDRWTSQTDLMYQIRRKNIPRTSVRSAKDWVITVAGRSRVKKHDSIFRRVFQRFQFNYVISKSKKIYYLSFKEILNIISRYSLSQLLWRAYNCTSSYQVAACFSLCSVYFACFFRFLAAKLKILLVMPYYRFFNHFFRE